MPKPGRQRQREYVARGKADRGIVKLEIDLIQVAAMMIADGKLSVSQQDDRAAIERGLQEHYSFVLKPTE